MRSPLDSFHGLVRRAAQSVRSVREYGTVLVTCSDEFNGEVRESFDRDVARWRPCWSTAARTGRARHRKHLLEVGPSSPDARRVLHEVESSIQQLSHREAQGVLDVLIAEGSPIG